MLEGQMSVFDFIDNPYESIGVKYTREGYTNVYDRHPDHPCEVDVIDHEGNRFRTKAVESFGRIAFDATKGRGYDICWWKEAPKKPKNKPVETNAAEKHMEPLGFISEEHARRICGPALRFEEVKDMIGDCVLMEQPRESATDWRIIRIHKYIKDFSSVFSSETEEPIGKQDRILALHDQKKRNSFLYIDELYSNGGRYPGERHNLTLYKIKEESEGKQKLCGDDDPPCAWKDGSHCATCQRKPKPEKGDCATCEYSFWKHGVDGTSRGCQYHGGHDGCHYEKRRTCRSCSHMRRCTSGPDDIYHGFGCFGFGISKSDNMNNNACHDYEPAADGEAWRTSDKAVDEWLDG